MCSFLISSLAVGQHLYWGFNGYMFHGETLLTSWVVFLLIVALVITSSYAVDKIFLNELNWYSSWHYYATLSIAAVDFIDALGAEHPAKAEASALKRPWTSLLLACWLYAFLGYLTSTYNHINPLVELESSELTSPLLDANASLALGSIGAVSYFYAGVSSSGYRFFLRYVTGPVQGLPYNLSQFLGFLTALEEVVKPTAITLRLFGLALADEVLLAVILSLTGAIAPIPLQLLGGLSAALAARGYVYLVSFNITEAERSSIYHYEKDDTSGETNLAGCIGTDAKNVATYFTGLRKFFVEGVLPRVKILVHINF
jgi:F0F1-type ATP synthase membrane subunit a